MTDSVHLAAPQNDQDFRQGSASSPAAPSAYGERNPPLSTDRAALPGEESRDGGQGADTLPSTEVLAVPSEPCGPDTEPA